MRTLSFTLENHVDKFDHMKDMLQQHQFSIGGNWEYDHGSFDRNLDEANQVWLRIPFQVKAGSIESEDSSSPDTTVRIGTPFVLKHVYNEGLDSAAEPRIYTALFDQFQEPVDQDASIEGHWVERAKQILHQVERSFV